MGLGQYDVLGSVVSMLSSISIAHYVVGPFVGTIVMQWYIFITTGSLVRAQAIITQLVFEHSLRIRMKAETAASTPSPSTAPTPDTASLADTAVGTEAEGHSPEGTEQTLQPSSASVTSSGSGKGKGKDKEEEEDKKDKDSNLVGKINNLVRARCLINIERKYSQPP